MNETTLTVALRALGGLIVSAWLGCASLAVMVFGAGGWQTVWGAPHPRPGQSSHVPVPPIPPAYGLPRGLAVPIGIVGAVLVWLAWRALRRKSR
jgi:hypothetical protein